MIIINSSMADKLAIQPIKNANTAIFNMFSWQSYYDIIGAIRIMKILVNRIPAN